MAAVKPLPVHHLNADYIMFWSFRIIEFIFGITEYIFILENRIPLRPVLGGVSGVALFITGHEQTQKTEFAIFISLMWSLLPEDLTNQNLFIFTAAGVVPCGGRKTSPRTSSTGA